MAKKSFRGFSINSDVSKELDEVTKKVKEKGSFWQDENLDFTITSASGLVEKAIIEIIKHIKEILRKNEN